MLVMKMLEKIKSLRDDQKFIITMSTGISILLVFSYIWIFLSFDYSDFKMIYRNNKLENHINEIDEFWYLRLIISNIILLTIVMLGSSYRKYVKKYWNKQ